LSSEFCSKGACAVGVAASPTVFNLKISTFGPSQLLEFLLEYREPGWAFGVGLGKAHEHADPPHALGLLRLGRERPRRRAAKEGDEVASSHGSPLFDELVDASEHLPRQRQA
jgi:hypothetical protein